MILRNELALCHHAGWSILVHVDNEGRVSIASHGNGNLERFGWFNQDVSCVVRHSHWPADMSYNFNVIRYGAPGMALRRLSDDKILYLMGLPTPLRKRLLWSLQDALRKLAGTYE